MAAAKLVTEAVAGFLGSQTVNPTAKAAAVPDPDPADFPLIVAEIGTTAPTLLEVATV